MKWTTESDSLKYREGETRLISKFLWFPTKLQDEWRWMERCFIIQRVTRYDVGGSCEWGRYKYGWFNYKWLDTPDSCKELYKWAV